MVNFRMGGGGLTIASVTEAAGRGGRAIKMAT
jgi:hypothetical protein